MATFGNLSDRLATTFKNLRGKGKLSAADVDGTVREIRRALLDADVSLDVVKDFTARVRERALGDEVSKALNPAQQVGQMFNDELVTILGGEARRIQFAKKPPTVIMLAGLQGAGKTTLAGKLAKWLPPGGATPPVRPAGPPPPHTTAPRTPVDPDEVLFVIDAMIGQDAVATAKAFQEGVDFTGVVLSKLDGDARGGAALSVASVTGRPIVFASTGEKLEDFEPFHPDRRASRILDLGDILTLIEQAQQSFDEQEALELAEKIATSTFTLTAVLK